uniref:Peptidase M60 domain-containing protein n=1 Tax=Ornithorhynchus anatinus TaxID=9258 RepID=F7F566_ORNAN
MEMNPGAAYKALVSDIGTLDFSGPAQPCALLLTGDRSFPVLVDTKGQVLAAAAQYGQGRMVVLAHESYLSNPGFARFLRNVVQWLKPRPDALVSVQEGLAPLPGCSPETAGPEKQGVQVGVRICDAYRLERPEDLVQFVKAGGGLLIGGQAWYWASQHGPDQVLSDFPGNRVTSVAGVYFTRGLGEVGTVSVPEKMPRIPLLVQHGLDETQDLSQLLLGVSKFNLQDTGHPSSLLVHGALAFPVGLDEAHGVFLAAGHHGRGRVVVASHENQLSAPQMKTFILNVVRWLLRGRKGTVGVGDGLSELRALLANEEVSCELTGLREDLSVYCCNSYSALQAREIQEFVAEGGGLLIGGQSWNWALSHPHLSAVADYPGNRILNPLGISILQRGIQAEKVSPLPAPGGPRAYHLRRALAQLLPLVGQKTDPQPPLSLWIRKLGQDCVELLKIPAETSPIFSSFHRDLETLVQAGGVPRVSKETPLRASSKEAVLLGIATELYRTHPGVLIQNCPEEPQGPPLTILINGQNKETWRSTGLYLPPWQTAVLTFPPSATDANLQVQVGCHSDDLTEAEELKRPPVVTSRFDVCSERVTVSSLWGGLMYIVLPTGCQLDPIPVTVRGAMQAPFFRLGEPWPWTLRHHPAPWAELETDNLTLTVPAENICLLDSPEPLLDIWQQIMGAVSKLAAVPQTLRRPERIVADVQISAGWMHAGYPIMIHLESVEEVVNLQRIWEKGLWGPLHELGHNQQRSNWEFPPHTSEATCNLWSVYVSETVLGIPRHEAHTSLRPEARASRVKAFLEQGAPLKKWEVFVALETYLQLQEAFGWEPFIQLFADYQTETGVPDDNKAKMNLWAQKFSQLVKKNLAPFFKAWGWPIEEKLARELEETFPVWLENPLLPYLSPQT